MLYGKHVLRLCKKSSIGIGIVLRLLIFLISTGCMSINQDLPNYVKIDDPACANRDILHEKSKEVTFPLSSEVKKVLSDIERKFDGEENCAGLAAPQIGYGYQITIFACPDNPELKKFRTDLTQTMPKTIWINPNYYPVGDETTTDWEGCFSVQNHVGPVKRHTKIRYEAMTPDGKKVEGIAEGFLARIIQHEIDHLKGTLCIDLVEPHERKTREEYIAMRKAAMGE